MTGFLSPMMSQPYEERPPCLCVFLYTLGCTDDFPASIFAYTDGHKNGSILYLAAATVFQVNTIHIDIRIFAG